MSNRRYTPDQIFCGLRTVWKKTMGDRATITPETLLFERFQACGGDEIDFSDVAYAIDNFFSLKRISGKRWREHYEPDWKALLKSLGDTPDQFQANQSRVTFRYMSEFLAKRFGGRTIEPVRVFGQPCMKAGAFFVMEETFQAAAPGVGRFPPSAAVCGLLRGGALRRAWDRLRWISEDRLPPLRWTAWDTVRSAVRLSVGLAVLALIIWYLLPDKANEAKHWAFWAFAVLLSSGLLLNLANLYLQRLDDPLPPQLQDCRAIATAMAGARHG